MSLLITRCRARPTASAISAGVRFGLASAVRRTHIQERPVADDVTRRPDPLTALAAGAEALARGDDLDEALEALVGAAAAAVGAESAAISLQDPDRPDPELAF